MPSLVNPHTSKEYLSAALVSIRLISILAGILLVQAFRYWANCAHDSRKLKAYVYGLVTAAFGILYALDVVIMRSRLLAHHGPEWMVIHPFLVLSGLLASTVVTLASQSFFAIRCYRVSGRSPLLAFTLVFLISSAFAVRFAGHIVRVLEVVNGAKLLKGKVLTSVGYSMNAGCMLLISGIQLYQLPPRERGFNESMDRVVLRVAMTSISTASLAAAAALCQALLGIFFKAAPLNYIFALILPEIEVISVLHVLLQREALAWSLESTVSKAATTEITVSSPRQPAPLVIRSRRESWDDPTFDLC